MADLLAPSHPPISAPPRGPHLLALSVAYMLFVAYGSLVPFDFQPMPCNRIAQRIDEVLHQKLDLRSRSDLLVNTMLGVPLGFLLVAALCVDRSRTTVLLAAPGVVLSCAFFAASIEFLQLFFPPRVASLTDIVSQGVGSCVGVLAWVFRGQAIIDWCRRVASVNTPPGLGRLLLPSYVVLLVALHTAPFDLITRPKEAVVKWRAGRIHLIPFQTFYENPIEGLDKALITFAYFLPVGLLWGLGPIRKQPRKVQFLYATAAGLAAAGSVEVLQLMVFSRAFDATDIVTGLLATVVGVGATAALCRPHDRTTTWRGRVFLGLAIFAWLAALVNDYWWPFDFSFDPGPLASRVNSIEWLPLADSHHGNDFQAILHLLDRMLLFMVLGALCAIGLQAGVRRRAGLKVVASIFAAASVLETGQLFLPSRHFGVTDVLVAVAGGWLGYSLIATLAKLANTPGAA
jgi:glycopeptide antibiotics resistance protein